MISEKAVASWSCQSQCLSQGPGRAGPQVVDGQMRPEKSQPQRWRYNAAQTAALQLEAQKAARGEKRASNSELAAQISELGGRIVTGQDVGAWFRNQQGKKRQRTGTCSKPSEGTS